MSISFSLVAATQTGKHKLHNSMHKKKRKKMILVLALCPRQGHFHGEVTIIGLALIFALPVKTRLETSVVLLMGKREREKKGQKVKFFVYLILALMWFTRMTQAISVLYRASCSL